MGRTIIDIDVRDVEKRKVPSKHYVYMIYVTWSDNSTNVIYRRYSRFFDFQSDLMDMFPEEAGTIDPQNRIIPFLPGKKFFGRSHIREVAVKRLGPIAEYCKELLKLPRRLTECKEVVEFFELEPEDIDPPKGKKASLKAKKISNPKPLEVFVAVSDYKKQDKGEISLQVGAIVEVVEKTETGWWFVNVEEEQGWVPSTCLEREDGTKEESTMVFTPGEEEQYLCTEEFKGQGEDEICLERGAVVDVMEKNLEGWWKVRYMGREGYAPATYLMKCEGFKVRRKQKTQKSKTPVQKTVSAGPQIVKSLHEVSDLLNEDNEPSVETNRNNRDNQTDDEFDDDYELPDEEKIYSINELSKILKEDKRGSEETDDVYESISAMKSRSLRRRGSVRPPPRPTVKPMREKSPLASKPSLERFASQNKEYVTVCDFSNHVGDGISFKAGQHVKVLEKNETGWWYIEFDDMAGWAPASYIETSGQTSPKLTVSTDNQANMRPKSPVPTSPLPKSPMSSSREDLTADEQPSSPKRLSAVGDLASALKSRLKPKGQGPPKPPKKDFLEDDSDLKSNASEFKKSENEKPNVTVSNSGPLKPGVGTKPMNRSMLTPPPPPPPPPGGKPTTKDDSVLRNKPFTPTKPKPNTLSTDISKKLSSSEEILNKPSERDSQPGKLNVSGLAGALKARFEGSENPKPEPPNFSQKPKPDTSSKPALKPVQKKPEAPPTSNKPKDINKPQPFNKPNVGLKPTAASNKPPWVKSDGDTDKPPWVKPDKSSEINKKPWTKPKNVSNTSDKPSWVTKSDSESESNTKPWAKPKAVSSSSDKPSWVKNDNAPKAKEKTADENTAPKVSDLASVLKAKFENKASSNIESNVETTPPNKPKPVTKPVGKPSRPETSPGSRPKRPGSVPKPPSKPSNTGTDVKIDANKYSSRPLPPKPAGKKPGDDLDNIHDTKSFPTLPGKPKPPAKVKPDSKSDSDSEEPKPMGVSGLANALKAKLGGKVNDDPSSGVKTKPLPVEPFKPNVHEKKSTGKLGDSNMIKDKENNNVQATKSGSMYRAIADHVAGNDTEISLSVGLEVELIEKADGWWFVSIDSEEGWAPAAYLEKVTENKKAAGSPRQSTVPKAPKPKTPVFRTCSDFEAEHEGELSVPRGQEVTVLDKDDAGGWWLVKMQGQEGWVPASYLEEL